MQKFEPLIRIPEHHDWVVFVLLGSVLALVLMLLYLQREATVREFLLQEMPERGNALPSWILISVVNAVLLATLASAVLPIVPRAVNNFSILGLSLNKFGYCLLMISAYYLFKTIFSYVYYSAIGEQKKWGRLYFVASKFYFAWSALLIALVFAEFFLPLDRGAYFGVFSAGLPCVFIFKNLFYALHRGKVLPGAWYYKILYICTLQIAPLLMLWSTLFF